jgi:hypothetical protein
MARLHLRLPIWIGGLAFALFGCTDGGPHPSDGGNGAGAGGAAGHSSDSSAAGGASGTGTGAAGNTGGGAGSTLDGEIDGAGWQDAMGDSARDGVHDNTTDAGGSVGDETDVAGDGRGCFDSATTCGCALCGNGQLDSCANEFSAILREECDGTEFTSTCADRGYASGPLRCNEFCRPNTQDCEDCVGSSVSTLCRRPLQASDITWAEFASNGSELGVAWLSSDTLHFGRLDADLNVLAETAVANPMSRPALALAPAGSGWIIAASKYLGTPQFVPIGIHTLDATGAFLHFREIEDGAGIELAARPAAGPLLTYDLRELPSDGSGGFAKQRATILNVDGSPAVAPFDVFSDDWALRSSNATFVGDGFWVSKVLGDAPSYAMKIARIGLDGQVQGVASNPVAESGDNRALVWNGSNGRVVFPELNALYWQIVDRGGSMVDSPVLVPAGLNHVATAAVHFALLGYGDDTVVLRTTRLPTSQAHYRVELLRIDASGATVLAPTTIALSPTFSSLRLARLGDEVFAMWVSGYPQRITVARLNPF